MTPYCCFMSTHTYSFTREVPEQDVTAVSDRQVTALDPEQVAGLADHQLH